EQAALRVDREPAAVGQRRAKAGRAGDVERVGAAAEIDRAVERAGAGEAEAVRPRAEYDATRISGIARELEPIGAGAEPRRTRDGTVRHIEQVVAGAEQDVTGDRRGSDTLSNRGLANRRAAIIRGKIDRDVPPGRRIGSGGADPPAGLDQIDIAREIDDRARRAVL